MCNFDGRIGGSTFSLLEAPLMEDMLQDARTGLTKAVVTGPGREVLFYEKHSMGEGLTADEAIDAAFLLSGAGMWVGKLAYLSADPMTIQEGWRPIAQAVTNCWVKVRGPGHPCVNLPAQQPFWFDPLRSSPPKDASEDCGSDHPPSSRWPSRAENIIGIIKIKGLNCLSSLHLPQTMGSRATRVCYWWLPQYCLGLTSQTDPDILDGVDGIKRKELAWR